ncbi:type 1 glutamine amidotransferase [Atopobium fossor]|uniref:type 1 glutamine amidotransferase n=1 Tax=Atopobium fossor TaxID=39487 RepID=UPI000412E817|nr:glutamine amidotransferase [Atopobium fossor]
MSSKTIVVAHLFPELLNLYGDSGNMLCFKKRMEWRGIQVEIREVHPGDTPSFNDVDIAFIGGGSDREQKIVCDKLLSVGNEITSFVEDGGVLMAVCGGYQLLGHSYLMGNEEIRGLSLVDLYTDHGDPRLIGNIVVDSPLCDHKVVGYENHAGRTHLGEGVTPFGKVVYGHGNDGNTGYEGVLYKNVIGTYIHGPLLPKNPGIADYAISHALERATGKSYLEPLDDTAELLANNTMVKRLLAGEVEEA